MKREMIFDLLLSLLRYAVFGEPLTEEKRGQITEDNLSDLYAISDRQDLAHLVGYALKKNNLLSKESQSFDLFEKKIAYALFRTERIEYQRKRLCNTLEKAGIDHIPLKGAVVRNFYPETWMRTSSDADVLIPKDCLEQAVTLLEEGLGYVQKERGGHDVSFTAPSGENMELHFDLVGDHLMPEAGKVLNRVWEMAFPCDGKESEKELSLEFFLFYHIAHMAKHINNGGVGIRFFLDYDLLCEKMVFDQKLYQKLLQLGGLLTFEEVVSSLCKKWFHGGEETEKGKMLEDLVFSVGIFGEQRKFVAIRRGNMGKLAYLKARLFASYETLCKIYPNLEEKKYLMPFYQFRRFLDHFRYAGFHKTLNEAKENLAMPSQEGEKMAHLVKELDLKLYN